MLYISRLLFTFINYLSSNLNKIIIIINSSNNKNNNNIIIIITIYRFLRLLVSYLYANSISFLLYYRSY